MASAHSNNMYMENPQELLRLKIMKISFRGATCWKRKWGTLCGFSQEVGHTPLFTTWVFCSPESAGSGFMISTGTWRGCIRQNLRFQSSLVSCFSNPVNRHLRWFGHSLEKQFGRWCTDFRESKQASMQFMFFHHNKCDSKHRWGDRWGRGSLIHSYFILCHLEADFLRTFCGFVREVKNWVRIVSHSTTKLFAFFIALI